MSTKTRFEEDAKGHSEMAFWYSQQKHFCFRISRVAVDNITWGDVT